MKQRLAKSRVLADGRYRLTIEGLSPHPVPLPRKLALASLPFWNVRKRMRTGEGAALHGLRSVRASLLPWGEGQDEGEIPSIFACPSKDCAVSRIPSVSVTFEPGARSVRVPVGSTLLFAAWQSGIAIKSVCGGGGKCGTCLVVLREREATSRALSGITPQELELLPADAEGRSFRLACMTHVHGDVAVHIPSESEAAETPPRKPYTVSNIAPKPVVSRVTLDIAGPYNEPVRPLSARIGEALAQVRHEPLPALSPDVLADFSVLPHFDTVPKVTAAVHVGQGRHSIAAWRSAAGFTARRSTSARLPLSYSCAISKPAEIRAVRTASNRQAAYGEDVISRMTHIQRDPAMLIELQSLLVKGINEMIAGAAREASIDPDDILDVVAAGNPAMQHILLGVNPEPLGRGPYMPLWSGGSDVEARSIGLDLPRGVRLYVFPMASGYIGGDTVAATLTRDAAFYRGTKLLVDIGTNGEVVLAKDGVLTATSCATGPVYEGAHIRCGMRAAPGAIERVWVEPDGALRWSAIPPRGGAEEMRPIGLCGSGVISGVAALVNAGIIGTDGAFNSSHPAVRRGATPNQTELVLVPGHESGTQRDIVITQTDVRNVQLGKAALRAGIDILLREQKAAHVDCIYLAGAFGNHLDPADILNIGMVPPVPVASVQTIGNAAGDGARMALFNSKHRRRAERLAGRLRVIELSNRPDFQDTFVECTELAPLPLLQLNQ